MKTFEYEYIDNISEMLGMIQECEGKHKQQVAFSTYHNSFTQVCFGCKKIRSNIKV